MTDASIVLDPAFAVGKTDPRLFGSARNLVSIAVLGNFLHLCAERTNCPHFGLLVGQQATLDSLRLEERELDGREAQVAGGHECDRRESHSVDETAKPRGESRFRE